MVERGEIRRRGEGKYGRRGRGEGKCGRKGRGRGWNKAEGERKR